mmetsp:Transcript_97377/g.157025  ORF Transcript_97377/g.157025 Transcript_97377/m.157025 type:complete len:98 (-) Transcript_97377:169-462(-)
MLLYLLVSNPSGLFLCKIGNSGHTLNVAVSIFSLLGVDFHCPELCTLQTFLVNWMRVVLPRFFWSGEQNISWTCLSSPVFVGQFSLIYKPNWYPVSY